MTAKLSTPVQRGTYILRFPTNAATPGAISENQHGAFARRRGGSHNNGQGEHRP
jgi:hypothetical protein